MNRNIPVLIGLLAVGCLAAAEPVQQSSPIRSTGRSTPAGAPSTTELSTATPERLLPRIPWTQLGRSTAPRGNSQTTVSCSITTWPPTPMSSPRAGLSLSGA